MITINTTRTDRTRAAAAPAIHGLRATALAMAFSVTALLFGGIDGLAHAPETGSLLAGATISEPALAAAPTTTTAAAAAVTTPSPRG